MYLLVSIEALSSRTVFIKRLSAYGPSYTQTQIKTSLILDVATVTGNLETITLL